MKRKSLESIPKHNAQRLPASSRSISSLSDPLAYMSSENKKKSQLITSGKIYISVAVF